MPQNLSPTSIADTPLKKERPKTHKRRANDDRRRHSPTSHYTPDTPTPLLLKDNMNFSVDEYESVGERGTYRNAVLANEAQRDIISSPQVTTVIPSSPVHIATPPPLMIPSADTIRETPHATFVDMLESLASAATRIEMVEEPIDYHREAEEEEDDDPGLPY